jgi:CspA family cold shock protein
VPVGTVKWFDASRGYGYIAWAGGADVFVHSSAIEGVEYDELSPGQRVEFEVVQGLERPRAASVRPLRS